MKVQLFAKLSLRGRFLTAIGIAFIPAVVVAIGAGMFLQQFTTALDQIIEHPVRQLQATAILQNQIRKSHALVREYTETPRTALHTRFDSEAAVVDERFEAMLVRPDQKTTEAGHLSAARREWKESRNLANMIFSGHSPKAAQFQLDQRVIQIMFLLDQIYAAYSAEIDMQRAQFDAAERRFLLILSAALAAGLLIAIAGAVWLTRSVLGPLRVFEQGMTKFSQDNLSYRLPLEAHDEIGHLAHEFNAMAERLMQHQFKLEELSARDGLTGLYNRRELEKRLHEETQRARRYHHPLSVMMLDIDHFKNVNDRFGHQAGDEVLISVADLIQLHTRPVDVVCRYGGEELFVILPETEIGGALTVAERIRATVEESTTTTPAGDMIRVTISIGVSAFPRDSETSGGLIHAADSALYRAKQEGRNLVRSQHE